MVPALGSNKVYTKESCEEIARHVVHPEFLPAQCEKFPTAVQYAKSHDKDTTHPTQLLS